MTKIKPYKQSFYETCMTVCLMLLCGIKPSKRLEFLIWKNGWKQNVYLSGQINFIAGRFQKYFTLTVESKSYLREVNKKISRRIKLESRKIDIRLIKKKLNSGPVIIYLDDFYIYRYVHYPHSLLALGFQSGKLRCADPWDGKIKWLKIGAIKNGIRSLRNHLKYSPILISENV